MEKPSRREKEKQTREAEIIAAAEKLFYKRGFDNVSMDQIASEAEFTKRTLYQYFSSKEDLYFAVALRGFKQLFAYCKEAIQRGLNGFDKVKLAFMAYYRFSEDNPAAFRVMNYMGYVKKKATAGLEEWQRFDDYMFRELVGVFELGKRDGSLRADLDARKAAYAMAFITTGFFHQLSETGQTFTAHYRLDQEEFCRFALDLLSAAVRA